MLDKNLNNKYRFNKSDIVSIGTIILSFWNTIFPINLLFITFLISISQTEFLDILIGITFFYSIISWLVMLPSCYLTLFITTLIKIFLKNKTKKDYIIIGTNLLFLFVFGFVIILGISCGKVANNIM